MSGRKIPLVVSGHSRPVPDLSYSPVTPDGFFLVSACLDGKPMIRNGETGDWIGTFVGHKGAVWSSDIDSAALRVVTASADYTVKIWNALNGDEVHTFAHQRIVKSARFSKNDKQIVTAGQDKIVRVFDLAKTDADPVKFEGHTDTVRVAVWAGNDNVLLSGGGDGGVRIWDVRSGKQVSMNPTKGPVTSIEVCLDGKHIITTSGKTITVLDAEKFEEVKSLTLGVEVNSASLSPDGTMIAAGCIDFSSRVYDFKTHNESEVLKGHHGPVHVIRFAPDGATFASGSEDGTIRLWQAGDPRCYGLWQENKDREPASTADSKADAASNGPAAQH
eukprot:TRINITY_DN4516_c0_g1_i1.p2 TRINITY_DN4516_c0_g1~~TRINITY_DN4516_c0_g1_i1.p2  ORF type:complete len:332 (+),score=101.49 TRINITY_DN4516_c0_g1_i1:179-1174(+)